MTIHTERMSTTLSPAHTRTRRTDTHEPARGSIGVAPADPLHHLHTRAFHLSPRTHAHFPAYTPTQTHARVPLHISRPSPAPNPRRARVTRRRSPLARLDRARLAFASNRPNTHLAAAHSALISPSANCTVRLFGCPRTLNNRSITLSTSSVVVMIDAGDSNVYARIDSFGCQSFVVVAAAAQANVDNARKVCA
jgi:hypothetical protein